MSEQRLIRLRLSAWMVQLVWAVLEKLPSELGKSLVLPESLLPADDEDLREAWRQSLLDQLDSDFGFLRKILARLRSNGVADLDAQSAETFLRSVTAVRLSLQRSALANLPQTDLQTDSINIETLPEESQPAYACYLLLADIQGQVIAQIEQYENAPSAPLSEYPDDFFHIGLNDNADSDPRGGDENTAKDDGDRGANDDANGGDDEGDGDGANDGDDGGDDEHDDEGDGDDDTNDESTNTNDDDRDADDRSADEDDRDTPTDKNN